MRKKNPEPELEAVIDQGILMQAKLALQSDKPRVAPRCVICGSDAAPTSNENLCWVCRRLKISAWRESDPQMSAQE
jgi:hypothetical protein